VKIIGINGSPRKYWNTATFLEKALEGAASKGAETELIHLYNLNYRGCISCFACKLKGGKSYGKCAMRDGLTQVLHKLLDADGFVLGSPVYFGGVTGEMKSFMERLLFQHMVYTHPPTSLFSRKVRTAFIYTMNVSEEVMREFNYPLHIGYHEKVLKRTFGETETLCCNETLQFEDYDKVVFSAFDPEQRKEKYRLAFPDACQKAFELGGRLVSQH
jgi:multimeric flavodoxin WrbA